MFPFLVKFVFEDFSAADSPEAAIDLWKSFKVRVSASNEIRTTASLDGSFCQQSFLFAEEN